MRFGVNLNTGGALGWDRTFRLVDRTVHLDREHPSYVLLPEIHR